MQQILKRLPHNNRQTMLFSATQTEKVENIANISLKDPIVVNVDAEYFESETGPVSPYKYSIVGSKIVDECFPAKSRITLLLSDKKQLNNLKIILAYEYPVFGSINGIN